MRKFRERCESVVVINLASTEKLSTEGNEIFNSISGLERALDEDSKAISPRSFTPMPRSRPACHTATFTPSVAADIPPLIELAESEQRSDRREGRQDGQTFIKSVLAPAFRSRALKVEGWFSTNILGNRDGLVLSDEELARIKGKDKKFASRRHPRLPGRRPYRRHPLLPPAKRQ
jgi:myo-inositol-1-phosphate synthase